MIKAADTWPSNAELIADVAKLYFPPKPSIADLTYGRGVWWQLDHPLYWGGELYSNDLDVNTLADEHTDFRNLARWQDAEFDVVAFDPPYISPGGRKTSTIADFNSRFGLHSTPRTVLGLRKMNQDGLD